ncbi:MAG: MliC family protein [Rhodospirillales bacterium]|nr:MliC family protein [Alphaproteobacteria bacterium]USO03548.1 MAG: MliC family protein [Rhodospirillales bacterium]
MRIRSAFLGLMIASAMITASCLPDIPALSSASSPHETPPLPPHKGEPASITKAAPLPLQTYKRSPVATAQKLECLSGDSARVTIYSPAEAVLVFHGKTYDMKRVGSPLGAKYEGGGATYWNKGVDASIFLGGTGYACSIRPTN